MEQLKLSIDNCEMKDPVTIRDYLRSIKELQRQIRQTRKEKSEDYKLFLNKKRIYKCYL